MTQLSGAHAFRRFIRQLSTDFHEIWYRSFPSHYVELQKLDHLTCSKLKI